MKRDDPSIQPRKYGGKTPVPVRIRGVTYWSVGEAARRFGVTRQAVIDARRRDRLDYVGTGPQR